MIVEASKKEQRVAKKPANREDNDKKKRNQITFTPPHEIYERIMRISAKMGLKPSQVAMMIIFQNISDYDRE